MAAARRHDPPLRASPRALVQQLAWLRLTAIAGQLAAVLFVVFVLHLPIPLPALLAGIAVLLLFDAAALLRLRQDWPVHEWEAIGHTAVDALVLGYLLYLTGGASNPFVTLLLVPIALAATALSRIGIGVVAAISGIAYLALLWLYRPLPALETYVGDGFRLHIIGMAIDFAIAALLLAVFIARLAGALRGEQRRLQRLHERALRDEGILAMATQSASAAHELNTPLATMRMLLQEMRATPPPDSATLADLQLLAQQVDRCSEILREMVAVGRAQMADRAETATLDAFVHRCLDRFQLLRPEAEVDAQVPDADAGMPVLIPAGLQHALINLLNNALDASQLHDSAQVHFSAQRGPRCLEFRVRDHGPGFGRSAAAPDTLGVSGKDHGLGIGLALAEATADRLGGLLEAVNAAGGGAEIRLRLPLPAVSPAGLGQPLPPGAHCVPS